MDGLYVVILLCFCAALLGAGGSFLASMQGGAVSENNKKSAFVFHAIRALTAALLTPLFLTIIGNDILPNVIAIDGGLDQTQKINCLKFFGFCLLTSTFSRLFLESMGEHLENLVKKNTVELQEAKSDVRLLYDVLTDPSGEETTGVANEDEAVLDSHQIAFLKRIFSNRVFPLILVEKLPAITGLSSEQVEIALSELEKSKILRVADATSGRTVSLTTSGTKFLDEA